MGKKRTHSGGRGPGLQVDKSRRLDGRRSKGRRSFASARKVALVVTVITALGVALAVTARFSAGRDKPLGSPGGVLEVAEAEFDFGRVPLGKQVSHGFEIRNVGTDPLTLGEPKVERLEGCCAMDATLGSSPLKPWATTRVTVGMMMHEGMGGYHVFKVSVPTSDPAHRSVVFTVKADYA